MTINAGGFVHLTTLPRDRMRLTDGRGRPLAQDDDDRRFGVLVMPWDMVVNGVSREFLRDLLIHYTLPNIMRDVEEDEEMDQDEIA